ncbi:DUF2935 domain-containing protein [Cohnella thailandensis]|uniref:DUF2935 domain-containing protein n=1 Tax=Cohnella thailandensis TaxID=557557 RepID=A0A841SUW4_9BACL|nr:DUF2935 domain-containing protein [Cohnella thailandensis]MBB6633845.1 DUF2935 domain-containing protein [Cohnella thailandensis]MBP1972528.1 hypothetical protein [Cohnella thailandensis]
MNDSPLFEHRFWLQILGDHARFLYHALSPAEKTDIQTAEAFIRSYDGLLEQARRAAAETEVSAISRQAYDLTLKFRDFKLDLLRRVILGKVMIAFTPTFLNHMVNELEEYLRILSALVEGKPVPQFDALHHDFLWLPDAAGHASAIASDLDSVEKRLIKKSQRFEKHFQQFYLKSIEMAGYMRTQLKDFPAFRRFHMEVDVEMKLFVAFLGELEAMEISAEALDRISPLMPDHMMREECYYLTKLARLGLVPNPECQPDRPRVQG